MKKNVLASTWKALRETLSTHIHFIKIHFSKHQHAKLCNHRWNQKQLIPTFRLEYSSTTKSRFFAYVYLHYEMLSLHFHSFLVDELIFSERNSWYLRIQVWYLTEFNLKIAHLFRNIKTLPQKHTKWKLKFIKCFTGVAKIALLSQYLVWPTRYLKFKFST